MVESALEAADKAEKWTNATVITASDPADNGQQPPDDPLPDDHEERGTPDYEPHELASADTHPRPLNIFPAALQTPPEWSAEDYPKTIADLANDISIRMGVDPVIAAWTAIAVAAALIHDRFTLQVKAQDTGWRESARLWVALVGEPSTKKSPAMNDVLAPLKRLQAEWHKDYLVKREVWKKQAAVAKKAKMPEPEPPHPRKKYVNDTTLEALGNILEHNDGGILAIHDELSGWFGSMDCYRQKGGMSKDRSAFLTSYNGGPLFIDRVGREPRYIPNFSVGIIGGIQPDPMRRIASSFSDDDGLLQRFIPLPVRPATRGSDVAPDAAAQEAWETLCLTLSDTGALDSPRHIRLSPGAQGIIDEARHKLQALGQSPVYGRKLQAALQKAEGQLARLVLTFHMVENHDADLVSAETAAKTARLFQRYVVPSIVMFYNNIIGSSESIVATRLAAGYILAHSKYKVTERDLYRAHREFRGDEGRPVLAKTMAQLELAAWVSPIIKAAGKPPTEWTVNPRVHTEFPELARKERTRRDSVMAAIQGAADVSHLSLEASQGEKNA